MPRTIEKLDDLLGCSKEERLKIIVVLSPEQLEILKIKYMDDLDGVNENYPRELTSKIQSIITELRNALIKLRKGEEIVPYEEGLHEETLEDVLVKHSFDALTVSIINEALSLAIKTIDFRDIHILKELLGEKYEKLPSFFPEKETIDKLRVEIFLKKLIRLYKNEKGNVEQITSKPKTAQKEETRELTDLNGMSLNSHFTVIPDKDIQMAIKYLDRKILDYLYQEYGPNLERIKTRFPSDVSLTTVNIVAFFKDVYEKRKKTTLQENTQLQDDNKSKETVIEASKKSGGSDKKNMDAVKPNYGQKLKFALRKANQRLETLNINFGRFTRQIVSSVLDEFSFEDKILIVINLDKLLNNYPADRPAIPSSLKMYFSTRLFSLKKENDINEIINQLYEGNTQGQGEKIVETKPSATVNQASQIVGKTAEKVATEQKEDSKEPTTYNPAGRTAAQLVTSVNVPSQPQQPVAKTTNLSQVHIESTTTSPSVKKPVQYTEAQIESAKLRIMNDPLAKEVALAMNNTRKSIIVELYFGLFDGRQPLDVITIAKTLKFVPAESAAALIEEVQNTILEFMEIYSSRNKTIEEILKSILKK